MDKSCEEIADIASRLGYDAVEIRGDNNALGLFGLPLSDAKKIKEVSKEQQKEIIERIAEDYIMYAEWYR